jgi:hypothetical protein
MNSVCVADAGSDRAEASEQVTSGVLLSPLAALCWNAAVFLALSCN